MTFLLLLAALICNLIATAMGFEWFGMTRDDWFGWIALGAAFLVAALLIGAGLPDVDLPRVQRRRD